MRRFIRRGFGLLLVGVVAHSAAAQRSPAPPTIAVEEPRANPVLPVALVPFSIASDVCKRGHVPRVFLQVYNVIAQPVATLHLRDRPGVPLDGAPLRCGQFVALWDGTVGNGARAAPPGLYYFTLTVDSLPPKSTKLFFSEF